ncbi:MAG: nucleotidyltransferase domain-containing protein [Anaerolineae bacterium]
MAQVQTILAALKRELTSLFGDRLDRIILYGSHARGQAQPGSDIDVLIVLQGDFDYGELIRLTSPGFSRLSLAHDVVISRAFVTRERYEKEQSPFLLNVRREGVPV